MKLSQKNKGQIPLSKKGMGKIKLSKKTNEEKK
jgi:hypothetical protein